MNAFTKMSDKGQVVVPKAVRELKGWLPGTDLEVIDLGDGIMLRPRRPVETLTVDEAVAKFRALYLHAGAPVPVEQLSWNADWEEPEA
jgi:AbrB family looped-hinge helix DNA binding protein